MPHAGKHRTRAPAVHPWELPPHQPLGAMAPRVWMALGMLPLARAFVGTPAAGLQSAMAARRDGRVAVRGGVRARAAAYKPCTTIRAEGPK